MVYKVLKRYPRAHCRLLGCAAFTILSLSVTSVFSPQPAQAATGSVTISANNSWRFRSSGITASGVGVYQCHYNARRQIVIGKITRVRTKKTFIEIKSAPKKAKAKATFKKARKKCLSLRFKAPTPIPLPTASPTTVPVRTPTATPTRTPTPTPTPFPPPPGCTVPSGYNPISTKAQLLSGIPSNGRYFLCNNIDLTGEAVSVAPLGERFSGIFDGNNKSIINLTMNNPGSMVMGFARTVGRTGVIRNVTFENASLNAAAMCGVAAGLNGGSISGVIVTGSVTASAGLAGGIVGVGISPGAVTNSLFEGIVTSPMSTDNPTVGLQN